MRNLFSITLAQIWNFIKTPEFVIMYMAVMVVLMGLIVIAAIINERRLNSVNKQLKSSANKASEQAEVSSSRFEMLKSIDERWNKAPKEQFVDNFTLSELCEEFRNYAAGKLGLYYDRDTIRAFVSGLAVSHFIILQGMSGTGKTSLAFAFGEFLNNPSTVIPVQPMWKERSDLLGYYNEFTKRFNETPLLSKMYEANKSQAMFVTILDELNIARVEYYFAEFLSLMEIPNPELRYLDIITDKWSSDPKDLKNGSIKLPENMWFLGTANNDDSTFAISDKVYDRTMIIQLDHKAEPFEAAKFGTMPISAQAFNDKVAEVLKINSISKASSDRLNKLDEYLQKHFRISFGNRVMKQIKSYLPVYVACGGNEEKALDDILTKKVLRKLEMQNIAYRKKDADELIQFIEDCFGKGTMTHCVNYIRALARNS
ncbi:MAG: AAA family ATPase [Clostridiales bacterium]|nr:AAA family ATPase [Clostridiales bacterium]